MFALLRRATEMFPRSRELAYEIMILQKRKKKKKKVLLWFCQPHYSLVKHKQPDW